MAALSPGENSPTIWLCCNLNSFSTFPSDTFLAASVFFFTQRIFNIYLNVFSVHSFFYQMYFQSFQFFTKCIFSSLSFLTKCIFSPLSFFTECIFSPLSGRVSIDACPSLAAHLTDKVQSAEFSPFFGGLIPHHPAVENLNTMDLICHQIKLFQAALLANTAFPLQTNPALLDRQEFFVDNYPILLLFLFSQLLAIANYLSLSRNLQLQDRAGLGSESWANSQTSCHQVPSFFYKIFAACLKKTRLAFIIIYIYFLRSSQALP